MLASTAYVLESISVITTTCNDDAQLPLKIGIMCKAAIGGQCEQVQLLTPVALVYKCSKLGTVLTHPLI